MLHFLFFGSAPLIQEFQRFYSAALNIPAKKTAANKRKILEQGECEFDKTQEGGGFSVTRIMLECATEICMWDQSLRDESHTSVGFGNYSDKAFETLLSAE